jgi:D-cysteine desulfhydrase
MRSAAGLLASRLHGIQRRRGLGPGIARLSRAGDRTGGCGSLWRVSDCGVPEALWVKRDDRSCPRYGGNKPRKLEFLIGAALARGSRRLVTVGGLGTNHGLATAILGGEAGLAVTLVLLDQPVTPQVREKLLLYPAYGAELLYGRNVVGTVAQAARVLLRSAVRGEKPTLVPAGGSSATGNVGFVCAGLELGAQIEEGALPEPAEIFVPVGSGGTLAGLVVGLRLAGLSSRARGVLVSDILPPSPRALQRAARRVLRRLRARDPSLPELPLPVEDFALIRDQLGPGYGAATPAAEDAVETAADAGLGLETTYTGKCLAAIRALAARGALSPGPVLFWNTFSSVDPRPGAPLRISRDLLSPVFRRFLDE